MYKDEKLVSEAVSMLEKELLEAVFDDSPDDEGGGRRDAVIKIARAFCCNVVGLKVGRSSFAIVQKFLEKFPECSGDP